MNNTIKHTANGFEVINPATGKTQGCRVGYIGGRNLTAAESLARIKEAPVLVLKTPEGMTPEALAEIKAQLQKFLSEGRPLVMNTGNGAEVKFSAQVLNDFGTPGKYSHEISGNAGKITGGRWIEEAGLLKPEGLERIADRVGKRHTAEIKEILQEDERRERIAQLMKDDAIKKLEEANRLNFATWPPKIGSFDSGNPEEFEKLYLGTWDHELEKQTAEDNRRRDLAENFEAPDWTPAEDIIKGNFERPAEVFKRLSQNKIKSQPTASQEDPGPTNAKDRDNVTPEAINDGKPRKNRAPGSKKFCDPGPPINF